MSAIHLGIGCGAHRKAGRAVLPVVTGLEAYWDWTGGDPFQSKFGNHLLQQGAGSSVSIVDVEDGPVARAIVLDGATDFLVVPAASVGRLNLGGTGYSACTVFAWVERDDSDAGFVAGCWQEDAGDPRRQYGLFTDLAEYGGDEQVCGHVSQTGDVTPGYPFSRDYSANTRAIDNSRWQFVAFTYDGALVRSYLGPVFDARPSYTDGLANTYSKNPYSFAPGLNAAACDFTVGAVKLTGGMDNFFSGKIGALGIYHRALSLAELTSLFRFFKPDADPVYEWSFDVSGNSRVNGWHSATVDLVLTDDISTNHFGVASVGAHTYMSRGSAGELGPLVGWSGDLDGVSLDDISTIQFLLNSGVTDSLLRLVIKSEGLWYATDETFDLAVAGIGGSDWSNAVEQVFAFGREANKWRDLTFTPGAALSLSGSARVTPLPAGTLQAVGFYSPERPSAAVRIDNLKVFA